MTFRIGWLSPLTPTSGVGTFSNAILRDFPSAFAGEPLDITVLYVGHEKLYRTRHRSIQIAEGEDFHQILTIFDLLIYNIGNNREHHEPIFNLLRVCPGIVVCHDFVYQHYLADVSLRRGGSFAAFAALLIKHGDMAAPDYIRRSRITSRTGQVRYSPWDTEICVTQPMSEAILALGSALVVHSKFAQRHAEMSFDGPILKLGMPHDQKTTRPADDDDIWARSVSSKMTFRLVSFGHIQPTKCIDLVLGALASSPILRHRVRYTIAGFKGSPGYYEHLKTIVASSRLEGVVSFEMDVTEGRLGELLREADMFVNLRRPNTEGSSVSLIEQLDTGKPVIVLNSGCYAEIPNDAAVKLSAQAISDDLRIALEAITAKPDEMSAIGRAGRAYARNWTCASYARRLMRFVFEHRALLTRRATSVAIGSHIPQPLHETDDWSRNLARARTSLHYLHTNTLSVDPSILLGKSTTDLCHYAGNVIFGMFNAPRLHRALSRFFARLDERASYWACVRFAIIVDAVFGDDVNARERLKSLTPCYDPEFWAVIETFPPRQHLAATMLILARRLPAPEEFTAASLDDQDGFPKRLRARELLRHLVTNKDSRSERLERWLDESCAPALAFALPTIEANWEGEVGSAAFREKADLSGFYAMESDHAWTRGPDGFLGLRLKEGAARLDVLVSHIDASAEHPRTITLSYDSVMERREVADEAPFWISIDLRASSDVCWVKLSTDAAARPRNANDNRLLGVCFRRLRVRIDVASQEGRASRLRIAHGNTAHDSETQRRASHITSNGSKTAQAGKPERMPSLV